jgi:hypothetical protein
MSDNGPLIPRQRVDLAGEEVHRWTPELEAAIAVRDDLREDWAERKLAEATNSAESAR